jgi:hypothetical protein
MKLKEGNTITQSAIPRCTYRTAAVQRSPLNVNDFYLLKTTVFFTEEDVKALRMSRDALKDHTGAILDVWYGFVGSHPHPLKYF